MRKVLLCLATLALSNRSFAQLNVLTSGGFAASLEDLLPSFEKSTHIKIDVTRGPSQGTGPNTIGAQLRRGAVVDVVVMNREGLDDLITESRIVRGSDRDLAQTLLGVAVLAGAPKPDLTSVEAFKQMLLRARSVNFPSSTNVFMTRTLLPRLGIAEQMASKTLDAGGEGVAKGAAEIAVQPVSEILHVPGVDFAGTIPAELQHISVFSAAIVAGSKQQGAARRLIAFLTSDRARAVLADHGMEPPKSR